jgi:hypothetical protein
MNTRASFVVATAGLLLLAAIPGHAQEPATGAQDAPAVGVPVFRLSMGFGQGWSPDFLMTFSRPRGGDTDLEMGLLIATDRWKTTGRETRCSELLGCFTGTYVQERGSQASVAALLRLLHYGGSSRAERSTALALGGGPALLTSSDTHLGLVLDGGILFEPRDRQPWTGAMGFRVTTGSGGAQTRATWYVRAGVVTGR